MALVGALLGSIAWYTDLVPHVADAMNKTAKVATLGNGARYGLTTLAGTVRNWLKNHHQHQDAAHDVCHFRPRLGYGTEAGRQMTMSICW
ncbi:putative phosphohydrolase [Escherichia coli]|uniref:Putative phosphohydrolase n=1 Tax=Escherichia coli TaxID=562 RepID=A0A376SA79_ECOLX|nr:putative phosphohydrolase [Escherichia coli]